VDDARGFRPATPDAGSLGLDHGERRILWQRVIDVLEDYLGSLPDAPVSSIPADADVAALVQGCDLLQPMDSQQALELAVHGLLNCQVHAAHPRHFGLFMPRPTTMGVMAETLVAAFNPQAGSRHHSPFAVEVETHVLRTLGAWFGYDSQSVDGTMTSGGAEANHTAVLAALAHRFPAFVQDGAWALSRRPAIYLSAEAHGSFRKAARACGLGDRSIREIDTDTGGRIDIMALERRIAQDRGDGWEPVMVVATAGTTAAGVVDPIATLAELAEREGLWLHVDAAWGGAAAWLPELAPLFEGLARADSITFDPHKWLSVPLGAGAFLTRHVGLLEDLFSVDTPYLPEPDGDAGAEPYAKSLRWSRRFTGLKVFLSLLVAGREGYQQTMRRQLAYGDLLRRQLKKTGWTLRNRTVLPVVCFDDVSGTSQASLEHIKKIAHDVVASGQAWVCPVRTRGRPVVRACISGYDTSEQDVMTLVQTLADVRGGSVGLPPIPTAGSTVSD
jgi:glutamate/tyrosine decarboxylase-like PLP-dependent enzyme